jgi:hypothetical protein
LEASPYQITFSCLDMRLPLEILVNVASKMFFCWTWKNCELTCS